LVSHRGVLSSIVIVVLSAVAVTLATPLTSTAARPHRPFLASKLAISQQYHRFGTAVSNQPAPAVSRPFLLNIVGSLRANRGRYFQLDHRLESSLGLPVEIAAGQYQQGSDESKRRVMLLVGLALAAAYAVFVIGWIWATRLRSRPPRH
jgi:uncharacterized membrane protein YdfJ with MMPL/SSD domain